MSETAPEQCVIQAGGVGCAPNAIRKALAQLEGEMVTVFICTELPSHTRMDLQQRLLKLERKAGVDC